MSEEVGSAAAPEDSAATTAEAHRERSEALVDVLGLMAASPAHRYVFLGDLEWLVLPPLALGQCSVLRRGGRPFAFVSWAFPRAEVVERLAARHLRLRPDDWTGGEEAWIIDVVAPFGGADVALKSVRERALAGRKVKALQPAPDGSGVAVVEW